MISKDDNLIFDENKILTKSGEQVMMSWERPIMSLMAKEVCKFGGDILEVGFGMGISATEIQKFKVKSHTIVEINLEIYEDAKIWQEDKDNVVLINEDFVEYLNHTDDKFDGILFDPYPSEILGVGGDDFMYGETFLRKIKKVCKDNCRIVPFLPACSKDLSYLIDNGLVKSIESYDIELEEFVKAQYFTGNTAKVFVFNI